MNGPHPLVGSRGWAAPGRDATDKAYLFALDDDTEEWLEIDGLVPSDGGPGDDFGIAVALDAGVALIGAPEHELPPFSGAAYAYGEATATSVEDPAPAGSIPLSVAYPNPFHERTIITLTITEPQQSGWPSTICSDGVALISPTFVRHIERAESSL